ncbi:MAG: ATPase [Devosia sp.]|nr:ATPase [Devosia sp.]
MADKRVDSAERVIDAPAGKIYAALTEAEARKQWLPLTGMTGRFERFDASVGGGYRMVLMYGDAANAPGKSSAAEDIVEARFVALNPGRLVAEAVDFVSDDPAFTGTMTMIWELVGTADGTRVTITARDVPPGISKADHDAGLNSSLDNLAAYVA